MVIFHSYVSLPDGTETSMAFTETLRPPNPKKNKSTEVQFPSGRWCNNHLEKYESQMGRMTSNILWKNKNIMEK